MRFFSALALTTISIVLGACSITPAPEIPIHASEVYIERLTGQWAGNYWSGSTGRSGAITFTLEEGEGHAHGEVVMIPVSRDELSPAYQSPHLLPAPQPLRIEIIRAADGQMTGTLEPYRDPGCECLLSTSFVGTIRGDEIDGNFVSIGGPGHLRQTGRWTVERKVVP